MKKYRSVATWDACHGFFNNETFDYHDTKAQAEAVCRMLEKDGLGGERCHFPLRTRVEEVAPAEKIGAVANGATTPTAAPCSDAE